MKVLLFKIQEYLAEENRFGRRAWKELPSSILLTAAYLEKRGISVDLRNDPDYDDSLFNDYPIVVQWVSIAEGLYEAIDYLRVAKRRGAVTVMILFDDWEGLQHQLLEEYPEVDYAIRRWDVETSLERLIRALGQHLPGPLPGVVSRVDGQVVDGGETIDNPDDLHHLGSAAKWIRQMAPTYDQFSLRVSSGCPFKCTFCHIRGRTNRFRKVEDVLDEVACLPAGAMVRILSSDLLQNPDWTQTFCEELIARGITIRWETDVRANWLTRPDLLSLMARAGCTALAIGVESFHISILQAVHKGYQPEQITRAVDNLVAVGIKPALNMMIGHPEESEESLLETERFLQNLPPQAQVIGIQYLRPLPGTPVAAEAIAKGLMSAVPTYRDFFRSRWEPSFRSRHLSSDDLVRWKRRLEASLK